MGTWSEDNFANDDAADWVGQLEKSKGLTVLLSPIESVISNNDYLEIYQCYEALAAAEIVASGVTGDTSTIPKKAHAWLNKKQGLFGKKPQIKKEHALIAKLAVEKIIENSELKELWEETEHYSKWQTIQHILIEKLNHA